MAWRRLTRGNAARYVNLDNVLHLVKTDEGTKVVFLRDREVDQFIMVDQSPEEILGDLAR